MSESFAKGAFSGELSQDLIFPYPSMDPDAEGAIPPGVLSDLASMGIMGMIIPEEYGGSGMSVTAYCKMIEELATHSAAAAVTVGAHQSIGMKAIILYGTEEQKARLLPPLAAGEQYAAFALTEPGAGSDAGSIQSTAVPTADGQTYILNGTKQWITNAGFASVFTILDRHPRREVGAREDLLFRAHAGRERPEAGDRPAGEKDRNPRLGDE
jgi:acyl-CoA dehydrogenase family protein 9